MKNIYETAHKQHKYIHNVCVSENLIFRKKPQLIDFFASLLLRNHIMRNIMYIRKKRISDEMRKIDDVSLISAILEMIMFRDDFLQLKKNFFFSFLTLTFLWDWKTRIEKARVVGVWFGRLCDDSYEMLAVEDLNYYFFI